FIIIMAVTSTQSPGKGDGTKVPLAFNPWFLVSLSCSGGLIFGYNTGIIALALNPISNDFDLDTVPQSLIVVSILLGALIGSVGGGVIANKIGRRYVVLFTALSCVGGAIGSAAVNSVVAVCLLRVLLGLGVGCGSSVCPLMVAENVPKEKKGFLGSFFQIAITVGILLANVIGLLLKRTNNGWRWMFAIGAVPGVMLFVCWFIMKESPSFEESRKSKAANNQSSGGIGLLFTKRARRPMFIGFILAVVSQFTGINAFMYFSTKIFLDAGIEGRDGPEIAAVILQIWNVSTTLIAISLVERVGRKALLFTGAMVMTISDLVIAFVFLLVTGTAKGWTAIVFLFMFVAAFEASIGTLFWFVINEIMPEDIKNIGSPIINAMQWCFNLILSFVFLFVVKYLGQSTMFWIFGGIGLVCTVSLYLFLPDIRGGNTMGQEEQDVANNTNNNDNRELDLEKNPEDKQNQELTSNEHIGIPPS
ncbi:hypothetical protein SAMD00019534_063800, partial [Acytostelium subglobosum LB1]|uniref:hypothetical protein n=1 Tax=Acytostelium subglobosum LB1 TaxID=1410327 RepID=UPI000644CDBB